LRRQRTEPERRRRGRARQTDRFQQNRFAVPRLHQRLAIPVASHRLERGEDAILLAWRQQENCNRIGPIAE
jgi:hypothetical protein